MLQCHHVKNGVGEKRNVQIQIFYVFYRVNQLEWRRTFWYNWRNIETERLKREKLKYHFNKSENALFRTDSPSWLDGK